MHNAGSNTYTVRHTYGIRTHVIFFADAVCRPGDNEEAKRCRVMCVSCVCSVSKFFFIKSIMVKFASVSAAIIIGAASTSAFAPTNSPTFVNKQVSTSTRLDAAPTMVVY